MTATLSRRYVGYWCDNCETVWPFVRSDGNCPDCRTIRVRAADVTMHIAPELPHRPDVPATDTHDASTEN